MEKESKPFGFRLPIEMAIEVKVAAVRRQIPLQDWFFEATQLKLKTDQGNPQAA